MLSSVIICSKIGMLGLMPIKTVISVLPDFPRDKDDQAIDPFSIAFWHTLHSLAPPA
jgi:hypothetical protein